MRVVVVIEAVGWFVAAYRSRLQLRLKRCGSVEVERIVRGGQSSEIWYVAGSP